MTDSSSFNSGNLIYGADLQNLHALVTSKCAAAGVAGPGYGSGNYAGGSLIYAAHVSDLVAAYQRAWDASVNKPGTRQSQVSAGNLIAGALFQNMWTQLGQMTFDLWASWNETTEAGLASSTEFVCIMENATAGGGEAGQGGGFSGGDLVFTPTGSIPGITGSPATRRISGGSAMRFDWTQAALETILKTTASWSLLWCILDKPTPNGVQFLDLWDGGGNLIEFGSFNANTTLAIYLQMTGSLKWNWTNVGSDVLPTTGPIYFGVWKDAAYIRAGWSTSRFTKWSDLGANKRISLTDTAQFSAIGAGRRSPFGSAGAVAPDIKCRWFVASKRCLIDNAA